VQRGVNFRYLVMPKYVCLHKKAEQRVASHIEYLQVEVYVLDSNLQGPIDLIQFDIVRYFYRIVVPVNRITYREILVQT